MNELYLKSFCKKRIDKKIFKELGLKFITRSDLGHVYIPNEQITKLPLGFYRKTGKDTLICSIFYYHDYKQVIIKHKAFEEYLKKFLKVCNNLKQIIKIERHYTPEVTLVENE